MRSETIGLAPAFRLDLEYDRALRFDTLSGYRTFFQVRTGRVSGARLSGAVADDGGDWAVLRPDGVIEFDSRMMIRADDGELIYLRSRGVLRTSAETLAAFRNGGTLECEGAYFRCAPYFDASVGPHDWLTKSVFLGVGSFSQSGAVIDIFEVE